MLILTREAGKEIVIGDNIVVRVERIGGGQGAYRRRCPSVHADSTRRRKALATRRPRAGSKAIAS